MLSWTVLEIPLFPACGVSGHLLSPGSDFHTCWASQFPNRLNSLCNFLPSSRVKTDLRKERPLIIQTFCHVQIASIWNATKSNSDKRSASKNKCSHQLILRSRTVTNYFHQGECRISNIIFQIIKTSLDCTKRNTWFALSWNPLVLAPVHSERTLQVQSRFYNRIWGNNATWLQIIWLYWDILTWKFPYLMWQKEHGNVPKYRAWEKSPLQKNSYI